jgi:hypothetical protein
MHPGAARYHVSENEGNSKEKPVAWMSEMAMRMASSSSLMLVNISFTDINDKPCLVNKHVRLRKNKSQSLS